MTDDNNDDLKAASAPPAGFEGDDFDDFDTGVKSGTLADLWHNNPLAKVAAIVAGLILIVGIMVMFGSHSAKVPQSSVSAGADTKSVPGTQDVSAVYANAVKEVNQSAAETAEKTGGSAIPQPITPPKQPVAVPAEQAQAEDPLARWRRIQAERTKQEQLKRPAAPPHDDNAQAVKTLAEAMAKQMDSILKNLKPVAPQYKLVQSEKEWQSEQDKATQVATAAATKAAQDAGDKAATKTVEVIVPAGQIAYAQLITQANTDAPGPILAEIMSGPLTGDRILGSFESTDNYLVLTFDTVVINGISHSISAIALDPNTATPGMVSDIDHRYFQRVIMPAAAAFIEGMGSAISDNGNTSATVSGDTVVSSTSKLDTKQQVFKGVEKGASKLSDILDKDSDDVKPLITVDSGTTMGILFTAPVTRDADDTAQSSGSSPMQSSALH